MPSEIRVPQLGESVVEATVIKWSKQPGDKVAAGDPLVELETDKVNVEVPAEEDGTLGPILRGNGETVSVGEVLGTIVAGAPGSSTGSSTREPVSAALTTEPADTTEHTATSPVARKLAEENGINLRAIKGSGPGGRVVKEDVMSHIEQQAPAQLTEAPKPQPSKPEASSKPAVPLAPSVATANGAKTNGRFEERVPMSRRRQTIASRLVEAQHTAAMLTTFNEVDMTSVMEIRKRRKDSFKEKNGVNLGFMSFFTKAAVGALKTFSMVNAELQGDEVIVKHYYDIGVAVSTEQGLVVPVLRDADRKTFAQIEKEIVDLAGAGSRKQAHPS